MKIGTFVVKETAAVYPAATPSERMSEYGSASLTDAELLSLILGRRAVESCDIAALMNCTQQELIAQGFSRKEAGKLLAAAELSRRIWKKQLSGDEIFLNNPSMIANYVRQDMRFLKQEIVKVLYLNNRLKLIDCEDMTKGTSDVSLLCPREVIAGALSRNCTAIAICHNHPSYSTNPSSEDIKTTQQLSEACKLMGIRLVDHVIIAGDGYYSFSEAGTL